MVCDGFWRRHSSPSAKRGHFSGPYRCWRPFGVVPGHVLHHEHPRLLLTTTAAAAAAAALPPVAAVVVVVVFA